MTSYHPSDDAMPLGGLQTRRQLLVLMGAAAATPLLATSDTQAMAAASARKRLSHRAPSTIAGAGERLRAGSLTSEALVREYLRCIKRFEPKLNAFITISQKRALATAARLDAELKAGKDRGPLHGIPIVLKDNIDTAGILTTRGSEFYKGRRAPQDAAVVRMLVKAGAVVLGKSNMNEFAAGVAGRNEFYGDAQNPWDLSRWPGGSSSGTAVAIASGTCLGGFGTDTGVSVRGPASWLGLVGMRPSYGRVSVRGVFPRAYSLDTVGPLARSVADAAALLTAVAGYDPADQYSIRMPRENFSVGLKRGVRGLRLGVVDDFSFRNVDQEVERAVQAALQRFASLGATVQRVQIPLLRDKIDFRYPLNILLYEFNKILGDVYRGARDKSDFGPVVQANLAQGENISKATYDQTIADRPQQIAEIRRVFRDVDALIMPTHPIVAPPLSTDAEADSRVRQFTVPISFTGFPAISVPCGFNAQGLPIGMQIVGNDRQEALLFRIAAAYERSTAFRRRHPNIYCR